MQHDFGKLEKWGFEGNYGAGLPPWPPAHWRIVPGPIFSLILGTHKREKHYQTIVQAYSFMRTSGLDPPALNVNY